MDSSERSVSGPAGLALLVLLAAILGGCAASPGRSSAATMAAITPQNVPLGRSQCPGSAPVALTNLEGPAADALERLQGAYEGKPGFLAVVFDGAKPIVVVEAARLPDWLGELGPKGITVATSCVDPALLAAVKAEIPAVAPRDGIVSAGYDGLNDSIGVIGVDVDTLLAALDTQDAGMGDRARAAINAGTLRINGDKVSGTR